MKNLFTLVLALLSTVVLTAQNLQWQWATTIPARNSDLNNPIASDSDGNLYAAAYFSGEGIMLNGDFLQNTNTISTSVYDTYFVKYNAAGEIQWYKHPEGNGIEEITDIDTDTQGNVYIYGLYRNGINIDGSQFEGDGIFLAKFDANGAMQWVKSGSAAVPYCLKVSVGGDVYISGVYYTSFEYQTYNITGQTSQSHMFLLKLDTNGNTVYVKDMPGTDQFVSQRISDLETDSNGNAYMTGSFNVQTTFEAITATNNYETTMFVVKFSPLGALSWVKTAGNYNSAAVANALSVDNEGQIYVSGAISGTVPFGGVTLSQSGLYTHIFLLKLDSSGNALWGKVLDGYMIISTVIDSQGELYATGNFWSPMQLDGITLTTPDYNDEIGQGVFIARFDQNGTAEWAISNEGYQNINGKVSLDITNDNTLYLGCYRSYGTLRLGNFTFDNTPFQYTFLIAKLSESTMGIKTTNDTRPFLYPNPTSGLLTLHDAAGITKQLNVTDCNGRLMLTTENTNQIHIGSLEAGIYFVTAVTEEGQFTEKVIKQ